MTTSRGFWVYPQVSGSLSESQPVLQTADHLLRGKLSKTEENVGSRRSPVLDERKASFHMFAGNMVVVDVVVEETGTSGVMVHGCRKCELVEDKFEVETASCTSQVKDRERRCWTTKHFRLTLGGETDVARAMVV